MASDDELALRGRVNTNEPASELASPTPFACVRLCTHNRFQVRFFPVVPVPDGLKGTTPIERTRSLRSLADIRISDTTSSCTARSSGKPLIRTIWSPGCVLKKRYPILSEIQAATSSNEAKNHLQTSPVWRPTSRAARRRRRSRFHVPILLGGIKIASQLVVLQLIIS